MTKNSEDFEIEVQKRDFFPYKGEELFNIYEKAFNLFTDDESQPVPSRIRVISVGDKVDSRLSEISKNGIESLMLNPVGLDIPVEIQPAPEDYIKRAEESITYKNGLLVFNNLNFQGNPVKKDVLKELFEGDIFHLIIVNADRFSKYEDNPDFEFAKGCSNHIEDNNPVYVLDTFFRNPRGDPEYCHSAISAHEMGHRIGRLDDVFDKPRNMNKLEEHNRELAKHSANCLGFSFIKQNAYYCDTCLSRMRAYWRGVEDARQIKILRK